MMSLSPNLPPDKQREMLRRVLMIRRFEERASADYLAGKIYGVVHCYIGEEAVAVGVCSTLKRDDRIISTHRGHGHCIAKGADLNRMMAELYGRLPSEVEDESLEREPCAQRLHNRPQPPDLSPPSRHETVVVGVVACAPHTALAARELVLRAHERR